MTIQQTLIERFIRTKIPFNITIKDNSFLNLYVDPSIQNNYDGSYLKAREGFPNDNTSDYYLNKFYDSKFITKTSFQTQEEKLLEIDYILKKSGFNFEHRKSQQLIDEVSKYLDDLDKPSVKDIEYKNILIEEINAIGIYGEDMRSMYSLWNCYYDNQLKGLSSLNLNDNLSMEELTGRLLAFALLNFDKDYDVYFKVDLEIVNECVLRSDKEVKFRSNKFSTRWAKSFTMKDKYLIMCDYEINDNEFIDLFIPIKAISVFGHLRASGGIYSQMAHSPKGMSERVRMHKMYITGGIDIVPESVQDELLEEDYDFKMNNQRIGVDDE